MADVRSADVVAQVPAAPEAEASVVGQMLGRSKAIPQVVGTLLEPDHFYTEPFRVLFDEIVSAYYADDATDALSIANAVAPKMTRVWACDAEQVIVRVRALAAQNYHGSPVDHAKIVKQKADYRALLNLAYDLQARAMEQDGDPEELAGEVSHQAMTIATSSLLTQEIIDFQSLGRRYAKTLRMQKAAREAGIEIGAYFGLSFLDSWMKGLRPSELWILGGEPGAGKSAVAWTAARMFAERQARNPKERQIGILVLSLEMAEEPSSMRVAQSIADLDGSKLREAKITDDELSTLIASWQRRKDIPLYFNFASTMRATQLRSLVVEGIRRHNVGLVLVDHFRYVDMDGQYRSTLEAEESLARFLKQDVATQLNVAVICLAHTTKALSEDGRPRLANLRGGQLVSGHTDWVSFVYRPSSYAQQEQLDSGQIKRTDAEMIWAKTRHGLEGTARFFFDPVHMQAH